MRVPALALILISTTAVPVVLSAQDSSVSSERWPRVTVGVPEEFSLLGSTTIDLYGLATAEIHALAEADGGVVRRLYWVQFEGYHEGSGNTYDYSGEPWRVEIDGRSFYAGAATYPKEDLPEAREGSDSHAIVELVRDAGLVLPDELARVRLVHLDGAHRNELMIIYLEDLALSGASLTALEADVPARDRLAEAVRDRAVAGVSVTEPSLPQTVNAGGQVIADTIPAPSLAGDLLGEEAHRPAFVYLPPGYETESDRRYATIHLLHGALDSPQVWVDPIYQWSWIRATISGTPHIRGRQDCRWQRRRGMSNPG